MNYSLKLSTRQTEDMEKFATDVRVREWISGFVVVGLLVGVLGPLLIAWQYHLRTDPLEIGLHFLAFNAGYVIAAAVARSILRQITIKTAALAGCGAGFTGLVALSFLAPPVLLAWRMVGLGFVGFAGGTLMTALLHALEPCIERSPAATVNRAGAFFGCGCLISSVLVGATYFSGSVQIETALLALVPLMYFVLFAANRYPVGLQPWQMQRERVDGLHDLRRVAAVLFGLLLFFQFGNEWAIAGWLPLFLIHRLGINPVWAISALSLYFASLISGRFAAQRLLRVVNHRKLLLGSTALAVAGYLLLSFTGSIWGALAGIIVTGAGFAPIYPLVSENLDERFSYRPGFYNGVFSTAITGAMCTPWLLGYVDEYLGIQFVMLLPAIGSVIVMATTLLLMFEGHLMSGGRDREPAAEPKPKRMAAASGQG